MPTFRYHETQGGFGYHETQSGFGYHETQSDTLPSGGPVITAPVANRSTGSKHLDSHHSYLLDVAFDPLRNEVRRFSYNHREPHLFTSFYWEPSILTPPSLSRTIVDGTGVLQSRASRSFGDIVLETSGWDDPLLDLSWIGAIWTFYIGPYGSRFFSAYTRAYIGLIENTQATEHTLTLKLRGAEKIVEETKAVLDSEIFQGTGQQASNIDEGPTEFINVAKIRTFGQIVNFAPINTDPVENTYQFDVDIQGPEITVRDGGVALLSLGRTIDLFGWTFTPVADDGNYIESSVSSHFRTAIPPAKTLTMSISEAPGSNEPTALFNDIAIRYFSGSPPPVEFLFNDIQPIPGQETEAGIFLNRGEVPTVAQLFDQIATSIGAFWYVDRLNRCRLGRVDLAATPIKSISSEQVLRDPEPELILNTKPVWKVIYNYAKNYAVLAESDLANDPANPDLNDFKAIATSPNQVLTPTSQGVIDDHPTARELTINSIINNIDSAVVEASRILALGQPGIALLHFSLFDELFVHDLAEPIEVFINDFQFTGAIVGVQENVESQLSRISVLGVEVP